LIFFFDQVDIENKMSFESLLTYLHQNRDCFVPEEYFHYAFLQGDNHWMDMILETQYQWEQEQFEQEQEEEDEDIYKNFETFGYLFVDEFLQNKNT